MNTRALVEDLSSTSCTSRCIAAARHVRRDRMEDDVPQDEKLRRLNDLLALSRDRPP
jgi:hypothetical protein